MLYQSDVVTTLGSTLYTNQLTTMEPPGNSAGDEERKVFLQYQLDSLKGQEVLGGYVFQEGVDSQACGGDFPTSLCTTALCAASLRPD